MLGAVEFGRWAASYNWKGDYMNRQPDKPSSGEDTVRLAWIILTILFTIILIIQIVRWSRGGSRIDSSLVPAAFIAMGLSHILRFTGAAQKIMLLVSALLAALAVVLMIIR
jgi:hypothetical protein